MTGSSSGGPESKDEKRLNDDLVVFMRKRSETDAPRYTERLKTYVNLQQKRRRAAAARRNAGYEPQDKISNKKKADNEQKDKVPISGEHTIVEDEQKSGRRVIGDKSGVQSRPRSGEQSDACRRARRRRSCGRRRRRRSRRRRSGRRRRRYSRRRRSRSRRRRRCSRCRRNRRRRRRC